MRDCQLIIIFGMSRNYFIYFLNTGLLFVSVWKNSGYMHKSAVGLFSLI